MGQTNISTEQAVFDLITQQPGIQAGEIALALGKSKGRISQVVADLRAQDRVIQYPSENGRGMALRPSSSWMHRRLVRKPWKRFREAAN